MPASAPQIPCSPTLEIDGLPYFRRLCDKVRLLAAGTLHPDYHANIGKAMDLWTCQFLGVAYEELARVIREGASDEEALAWAGEQGPPRAGCERDWWLAYMHKRGFRDDLSERLATRKAEAGLGDRDDIQTFFHFIDAEEGR